MFQRIKYLVFQFSTTSRIFSYIFLISLFFTVVVVGMGASYFGLFSDEALRAEGIDNLFGGGLRDSFWWSMKHVFDPGALSENYGAPPPVLAFAIFNSVSGLVIISALIGIIVNSINAVTEKTKSGLYTIREINHLLILGWNKKSIPILKQFAKQGGRPRIVILTSVDIQYVHLELRREAKSLKGLKILPMKGSIAIPSDLDRIAVSKAAYILLLADGIGYKNPASDVTTIKTLMLLNTEKRQSYTTNIVAEIEKTENLPIADVASKLNHPVVSTSDFIGKTMVQCARYPGYAEIYRHLFSTEKHTIEIVKLPIPDGALFGDLASQIEGGSLIGISWEEEKNGALRRAAVLNPEPGYDLMKGDELILIRSAGQEVKILEKAENQNNAGSPESFTRPKIKRALVLSKNPNLGPIVRELDQHSSEDIEIVLACSDSQSTAETLLDKYQNSFSGRLDIKPIEFNLDGIWSLELLEPETFDVIFLVANESDDQAEADNATILILLLLKEMKRKSDKTFFPPVIAEFLDQDSQELNQGSPLTDAVVSTTFLSMLLAQLVKAPFMERIYQELLSAGGIEIALRPIERYVSIGEKIRFTTLINTALNANEIAVGFQRGPAVREIEINPSKHSYHVFSEGDMLIVLAQQVYD